MALVPMLHGRRVGCICGKTRSGGLGEEGTSAEAGGGERGWRSLFVRDSTGPLFCFFIKQKKKKKS